MFHDYLHKSEFKRHSRGPKYYVFTHFIRKRQFCTMFVRNSVFVLIKKTLSFPDDHNMNFCKIRNVKKKNNYKKIVI